MRPIVFREVQDTHTGNLSGPGQKSTVGKVPTCRLPHLPTFYSTMQPIALCYGTRPQVIKASVLRRELARHWPVVAVDTGQHYDFALNQLLYNQLGVAPPDDFLEVGSASHAVQTATILMRMEGLLNRIRPAAMIVIGDTNSTLGCALAASKASLPVGHVEAGLRALDARMPEEINRRLVDAIATLLCAPGRSSTERLKKERADATVVDTGDVALDVLRLSEQRLPPTAGLLPAGFGSRYVFATLHRAELTGDSDQLIGVLETLGAIGLPVLLALHPRTRAALAAAGETRQQIGEVTIIEPVGYLESLALTRAATLVVTDSGGIQREAYWLGIPCITLRRETEWIETVDLGANRLVAPPQASRELRPAAQAQLTRWKNGARWNRSEYGDGQAAAKVVGALESWLPRAASGPV
jgi:UDP-GlcNAc3NAcA epimerase